MARSASADARRSPSALPTLLWLAGAAAWAYLAAALVAFDRADPPTHAVWPPNDPPANWCGPVGAWIASEGYTLLGWALWLPLILAAVGLGWTFTGRRVAQPVLRVVGALILTGAASALLALASPGFSPWPNLPGGTAGAVSAHALAERFGPLGATLWLAALALVGLVVAFDRLALAIPLYILRHMGVKIGATAGKTSRGLVGAMLGAPGALFAVLTRRTAPPVRHHDLDESPGLSEDEIQSVRAKRKGIGARLKETAGGLGATGAIDPDSDTEPEDDAESEYEYEYEYDDEDPAAEDAAEEEAPAVAPRAGKKRVRAELTPAPTATPALAAMADTADDEDEEQDDDTPGAPQVFTEDQIKEKIAALPVRFAGANRKLASEEDLRDLQQMGEMEGYRFPTLDLLEEPEEDFSQTLEELVREQAEALESALREYRIKGEVVGIESGPVITLYDLKLAPGTKVAQLTSVASDLARALKAVNIRIVANQVGRDTVGVEVPNPTKERVRLRELMGNRERFAKMKLPMFLGKDASGDPLIADLAQMPHMLIAGTTGSGKSVCMNTIIMSFLYTKKPNELKLVLVDPKMVEMSQFKDIPHLMCPVVTEMTKAAAILEWACKKMDERYELLAEAGCRDIASYNALEWEELKSRFTHPGETLTDDEAARIPRRLPYMVFVIDELADLMMTAKEVEGSIIRIAQKARAVGIHLILATQRPQANVVTGLIKSNMPCRVCFKVASGIDSRVVMDQKGGELLLGQGDMLFLSPRTHKLQRSQGTLVDDHEIRRVVKFLREVAGPSFERQLVQLRSTSDEERMFQSENHSSASLAAAQEDPLFDRAVEIVAETQRGSVSLLQRRLGIGYTRASRLIDLMGLAGIIGEHKGSVARQVMVTPEQWAQVKAYAEKETGAAFPTAQHTGEGVDENAAHDEAHHEAEHDHDAPTPTGAEPVAVTVTDTDDRPDIDHDPAVDVHAAPTPTPTPTRVPAPRAAAIEPEPAPAPDAEDQMLFDGLDAPAARDDTDNTEVQAQAEAETETEAETEDAPFAPTSPASPTSLEPVGAIDDDSDEDEEADEGEEEYEYEDDEGAGEDEYDGAVEGDDDEEESEAEYDEEDAETAIPSADASDDETEYEYEYEYEEVDEAEDAPAAESPTPTPTVPPAKPRNPTR